jgi:transcriptional regulator with XRE-family HTH domain
MPGLRELRARKRLSLEAVGFLAGLDPATVSRVERGRVEPTPRTVVALARALGVSVSRMREVLVESAEEAVTSEPRHV